MKIWYLSHRVRGFTSVSQILYAHTNLETPARMAHPWVSRPVLPAHTYWPEREEALRMRTTLDRSNQLLNVTPNTREGWSALTQAIHTETTQAEAQAQVCQDWFAEHPVAVTVTVTLPEGDHRQKKRLQMRLQTLCGTKAARVNDELSRRHWAHFLATRRRASPEPASQPPTAQRAAAVASLFHNYASLAITAATLSSDHVSMGRCDHPRGDIRGLRKRKRHHCGGVGAGSAFCRRLAGDS